MEELQRRIYTGARNQGEFSRILFQNHGTKLTEKKNESKEKIIEFNPTRNLCLDASSWRS